MNEEWLKENYEKAILVVATVIALALAGWLIFSSLKFGSNFDQASVPESGQMPETGLAKVEKASKALSESVKWEGANLFVSAPVIEKWNPSKGEQELIPVEGDESVHEPLTNDWINKYDLDITATDLKGQDPDGDNFTNLEEFVAVPKTDPTSADSHPAFITKVCLAGMVSSDLSLVFKAQVDPTTWQVDLVSEGKYRSKNMLVNKGSKFGPDNRFRLDAYAEEKGSDANGIPTDTSTITVSFVEAGGTARVSQTLVRDVGWEQPTHEGTFINQYDGEEFTAIRGSSFKLSNDPTQSFKIIEVTASKAIIKDQKGKDLEILPCQ
jgi:hypothetical protein